MMPRTHLSPHRGRNVRFNHHQQSSQSELQPEIILLATQVSPSDGIEEKSDCSSKLSQENTPKQKIIEIMSIDHSMSTMMGAVSPQAVNIGQKISSNFTQFQRPLLHVSAAKRYNNDDEESKYSHMSQHDMNLFSPGELHPKLLLDARQTQLKKMPSLPPVARKISNASSDGHVLRQNTQYTMAELDQQQECCTSPRLPILDKNFSQAIKPNKIIEQNVRKTSQSPKKTTMTSFEQAISFQRHEDSRELFNKNDSKGCLTMPNNKTVQQSFRNPSGSNSAVIVNEQDHQLFISDQNSGVPMANSSYLPSPNLKNEVKQLQANLIDNQLCTIIQGDLSITLHPNDLMKLLMQGQQQVNRPEERTQTSISNDNIQKLDGFPEPARLVQSIISSSGPKQGHEAFMTMADITQTEHQNYLDSEEQERQISFMNNQDFEEPQKSKIPMAIRVNSSVLSSDFRSELISESSKGKDENQSNNDFGLIKNEINDQSHKKEICNSVASQSLLKAYSAKMQINQNPYLNRQENQQDTPNIWSEQKTPFMTPNTLKNERTQDPLLLSGLPTIQTYSEIKLNENSENSISIEPNFNTQAEALSQIPLKVSLHSQFQNEQNEEDQKIVDEFQNENGVQENTISIVEVLDGSQAGNVTIDEDDEYEKLMKEMQDQIDGEFSNGGLPPPLQVVRPMVPVNNFMTPPILQDVVKLTQMMNLEQESQSPQVISRNNITVMQLRHSYEGDSLRTTNQKNLTIDLFEDKTKEEFQKGIDVQETVGQFGHSSSLPFTNELVNSDRKSNPFDTQQLLSSPDKMPFNKKFAKTDNAALQFEIANHAQQHPIEQFVRPQGRMGSESDKVKDIENIFEKVVPLETPTSSQAPKNLFHPSFCDPEKTLDRIDEDPSHENSTLMGNEQFEFDSCTGTSNYTYGQRHTLGQGLSGKSTEFNKGDLRQKNLRLNYLDPNTNNLCFMERPQNSGNPRNDRISLFAYSHGIDPTMFIDKDQNIAMQSLRQITQLITPRQPSSRQKTGRQGQFQTQRSIQDVMDQEVRDIRTLLHESPSGFTAQSFNQDSSDTGFNERKFMSDLMVQRNQISQSNSRRQTLNNRNSRSPYSQTNVNSPQLHGSIPESMKDVISDEIIMNRTQIAVLSLAFNRYLNNQDRHKVNQINRIIRVLEHHEKKLQEIMEMFRVIKKELHFAFLFASPIVIQQKENAFKFFPQLNFTKEFIKIRESINAAQVQINITKRQCTTDSLQEILAQKPIGLHFSGHGILNNKDIGEDFYQQNKGQGDFLVLENEKGGSELVSRQQLKKMIKQNKCELEFVFVATCHSEFVGQIFQEAGAKHVICIMHSKEVKDEAVITFTDTFYSMLFEQNHKICTAFSQAQLSVEISHSRADAKIFKLLLREESSVEDTGRFSGTHSGQKASLHQTFGDHDETMRSSKPIRHGGKLHVCSTFGPFQKGRYNYVDHQIVHLQNKAPKMPKLMGRQKDMFRVMDKILNSKNSRLFNLIGWPGMGKSALVASMLDYISERGLLKGGSIYFNARNISMCELFIRNFNQVLISENPTLFGVARERDQVRHEPIKTLESILAKIAIIDGDIVLVIDNAEQLIINERNDFSMLISMMLTRVSQLKILMTSQRPLQRTLEFKEEKIILSNLSSCQSANLFRDVMARRLEQEEINALLSTKPNFEKYPDERPKQCQHLHDHHLFTLLNGNPQSIILVASLLADPQKKLQLKQIYKMLTDAELFKVLAEEGIEESTQVSLRLSSQLSFQAIEESDPESVDLLYLLGLLPGGINPADLDYLWGKVTKQNRKMHIEAKYNYSAAGGNEQSMFGISQGSKAFGGNTVQKQLQLQSKQTQSAWRRAFAELKKGNLAEERQASRRSYNTQDEANLKKTKTDITEGSNDEQGDAEDDVVIILPEIVRTYSEGKITDETSDFFVSILSGWYKHQLHEIFVKNENIVYSSHRASKQRNMLARQFERLEENLSIFILRMKERHQEEKYSGQGIRRDKRKKKQELLAEETSDDSSLTDISDDDVKGFAEEMFSQSCSQVVLPATGTPDTIRQTSEQQRSIYKTPTNQHQQLMVPQTPSSVKSVTGVPILTEEESIQYSNFPELREAYLAVNDRKEALEKYIDAMKPNKMQHPKDIDDRDDKALLYWRWAFEKIKIKAKEQKRLNFQKANVNMVGGENLEESFDSDQSQDQTFDKTIKKYTGEPNRMELQRIGTRRKLKEQLTMKTSFLPIQYQRGSIKDTRYQNQLGAYTRQTSRISVYEKRMTMVRDKSQDELTVDEMTMIYYLVNLILYKQFNVANSLIKKHYLPMKKCSKIFKANVRRLQALSLYRMFICETSKSRFDVQSTRAQAEKYSRMQKLERCLKRAEKQFKRANCAWGLGLTYFQHANMLLYQMDYDSYHNDGDGSGPQSPMLRLNITRSRQGGLQRSLSDQAQTLFEQAAENFKEVNHWRGLFNTYRLLEQLMSCIGMEQVSKESSLSQEARERRDEKSKYVEQYKKYLNFYDIQRFSDNVNTDLTIQRSGGDAISLMTEIVTHRKQFTKLFEDPEKINKGMQSPGTSSLCTDSYTLSKVDENQSELESIATIPHIEIIPDGDLSSENLRQNDGRRESSRISGDFKKFGNIYQNERKISNQTSNGYLMPPLANQTYTNQQKSQKIMYQKPNSLSNTTKAANSSGKNENSTGGEQSSSLGMTRRTNIIHYKQSHDQQ